MSEKKKKGKKKRNVRSRAERIGEMERKLAEEKAKVALDDIKTAVKDENVSEENRKEFRKLLRQLKGIERAPGVLAAYGKEDEAKVAEKIRTKLIAKLENLMEEPEEGEESEGEDEEENGEGADDESDEEEEDDDEDDDDEDEDEDEDDDD